MNINWKELEHAHGSAWDVPGLFSKLAAGSSEVDWGELWSRICHQSTIYTASYPAFPLLLDLASGGTESDRLPAVVLVLGEQLPAAQAFLQSAGITKEKLDAVRRAATPGGRLAALPRPGGGYVFFIVAPDHASALALMETFILHRGLPD